MLVLCGLDWATQVRRTQPYLFIHERGLGTWGTLFGQLPTVAAEVNAPLNWSLFCFACIRLPCACPQCPQRPHGVGLCIGLFDIPTPMLSSAARYSLYCNDLGCGTLPA